MSRAQVRGPTQAPIGTGEHLPGRFVYLADRSPDEVVLAEPAHKGWRDVTRAELNERVLAVAAGLVARGVGPGDRVALMSPTRVEWTIADLAILSAGGITIPLYDTSSAGQCRRILDDAGAKLAFAATAELADRLEDAGASEVLVFDDSGLAELTDDGAVEFTPEVGRRIGNLRQDDIATVVYTSGTTGGPKGCVLTHRNLVWTVRQTQAHLHAAIGQGGSVLQLLPLAHIFARLIQFVCLDAGLRVGFVRTSEPAHDIRAFSPTFLLAVPRLLEKVFESTRARASGVRRPLFDWAVSAGQDWAGADRPGPLLRTRRAAADLLVYRQVRNALGGRVQYGMSGGAPLATELARFYQAARIPILEGYGLTETTAPATVNTPGRQRIGTVGTPLPGVEIRIDGDGEILVRGGNVFGGYHRGGDQQVDRSEFDDDWFRTGDLGMLDDAGFLRIHDRKKDLIVTANGKNVAPAPLEQRVESSDIVSQAMVVGDRRPFVAALVTLDDDELRAFAERHGIDGDPEGIRHHELVRREVQRAVDHANEHVSRAESIRAFTILDRQFTESDQELTPILKLRRSKIAEHFAKEIDAIYA
ncbi:MAG TPA: long-chain fatty acid--CoA ligase [Jiangellaceae bacterium]